MMDGNGNKRKLPPGKNGNNGGGGDAKRRKSDASAPATELKIVDFAECRARELEAMTSAIQTSNTNHRIYQKLPKHMRRRAMSHDPKRMPRRLREGHRIELELSNTKPISKRPSRKYRRRPSNLLKEYTRRKRRIMWLETHIWHAKRFRMVEKWGYKVPLRPNDKGIRAAHRAILNNCLLHDLSYMSCIELVGMESEIISALSHLSSKDTGLSVGAKSYLSGARQGKLMLYEYGKYPFNAIGPATFTWRSVEMRQGSKGLSTDGTSAMETDTQGLAEGEARKLWLWVHPACYQQVLDQLRLALGLLVENCEKHTAAETTDVTVPSSCSKGAKSAEDTCVGCNSEPNADNRSVDVADMDEIKSEPRDNLTDTAESTPAMEVEESKLDTQDREKLEICVNSVNIGLETATHKVESDDSKLTRDNSMKTAETSVKKDASDSKVKPTSSAKKKESKSRKRKKKKKKLEEKEEEVIPSNPSFSNGKVAVTSLKDDLCRFRLTGPLSQAILVNLLQVADVNSASEVPSKWWEDFYSDADNYQGHLAQRTLWDLMKLSSSPAHCCSNAIVPLTVRDPRVFLPKKKTHFLGKEPSMPLSTDDAVRLSQPYAAEVTTSPIWDSAIRKRTNEKMSTHELNTRRSDLLVPGTDLHLGPEEARIPVLLIQNPGTSTSSSLRGSSNSYGSGWDLIVPGGWGMAFWMGLIYRGARASGLEVLESTCLEMRTLCYPRDYPDSEAGRKWAEEHQKDLESYFMKRPPSKRPNYEVLNVQAPFHHPWDVVLRSLGPPDLEVQDGQYCVIRGSKDLEMLGKYCCEELKTHEGSTGSVQIVEHFQVPDDYKRSLVGVNVAPYGRGCPTEMGMICIPTQEDMEELKKDRSYGGPLEPEVEVVKSRPKNVDKKMKKPRNALPDLKPNSVDCCTRKMIGFLTEGKYSLVRGAGFAQGFCALYGMFQLKDFHRINGQVFVLVRDTKSLQYRFAKLSVIS